ncbi:MAG: hypothetical protein ACI90V_014282 [Bacillariaceae sp.]|jgi:hypothetical protein
MDDNINNEEDQQHAEQERIATSAAAAAKRRRHLKISSVLERKEEFPLRNRKKIDVLIKEFLENLGDDIHDMLCENDLRNYDGLDSDRDTEEEVETAIQFFPEVLSKKGGDRNNYPIQYLVVLFRDDFYWGSNLKAVSFIPLLARLAIELGLFEEEERGGLLCEDTYTDENVLKGLMYSNTNETDDEYLYVSLRLRKMGLLRKEDIQTYDLLNKLCWQNSYFAEMRFRFLVEWDPNALTHTSRYGCLPLSYCAGSPAINRGFQLAFEAGIKYFPNKKGINLLFHKNNNGKTPFQLASKKIGHDEVMEVIEDTLIIRYSDTSINTAEALVMAAIDQNIDLDGVYFLLRREPDVIQKLLSSTQAAGAAGTMDSSTDKANRRDSQKRKRKRPT